MWRSLFLAIGLTLLILGGESMVVERAVLTDQFSKSVRPEFDPEFDFDGPPSPIVQKRSFSPPEWAPWSLISAGAVVILYSVAMRPNSG
jgi:hypothetical protein